MILCDAEIKEQMQQGNIDIYNPCKCGDLYALRNEYCPYCGGKIGDLKIQPASVDLHLGEQLLVMRQNYTDPALEPKMSVVPLPLNGKPIMPQRLYLAATNEVVYIGNNYVGRVEGKSSLGRLGLTVHITAGFIDPGFLGNITLELWALTDFVLYPGMPIWQINISK
jgi:dCTP deaminase